MKSLIQKVAFCIICLFFSTQIHAQNEVRLIKFNQLENVLKSESDTVYVVNFWATWCAPCIKELPDFEQVRNKYKNKNFRMILVSLDFSDKLEKRVIPFVQRKNLSAEVWLLDEPDYNSWIDKVEPSWEGDIPVTLIFNPAKKSRTFINGGMHAEELEKIIEPIIK